MVVNWTALLSVVAVSFSSAVAVVVLVALAMLGLSARRTGTPRPHVVSPQAAEPPPCRGLCSPRTGTAVAVACLGVVAVIVLVALYRIVAP